MKQPLDPRCNPFDWETWHGCDVFRAEVEAKVKRPMKRDPLFFRLFKELPSCFFQLVGRSERDAQRYQLEAIECKATSVRLNGVFRPLEPGSDPAYLWEAQFHASDKVYASLLSKIGRFLEHGNPGQDWVAAVSYPNRALEQKNLRPYRCSLESD